MANRTEQRLILGKVLGVPTKGVARHELVTELESRENAEALQVAYKAIARKVNGFKGKPETRVNKAIEAVAKQMAKAATDEAPAKSSKKASKKASALREPVAA